MLIPTPRLLLLTLAGLVPIVLAGTHDRALGVACVWLAAVVLLALIDGWFVLPGDGLRWTREHDLKLSLGVWNPVTLTLHNLTERRLVVRVRDAVPQRLIPRGEAARGQCAPRGSWSVHYHVFPIHRGDYSFGPVGVRLLAPLGLVWLQYQGHIEDRVQVYPDLLSIRKYEALVQRGRAEEIGLRSSRHWGRGTEFERLRDYTPDDEYRRINWKATARRNKPIAVDYQVERSQNVILVLDAGRLMATRVPLDGSLPSTASGADAVPAALTNGGAPIHGPRLPAPALTRLDYAVNTTTILAFVSQQCGDRVGLLAFSDRPLRYVPPAPGRGHFNQLAQALYNLEPEATEADYAEGLGYLAVRNRRRSLAVIFTDLAEQEAADSLVRNLASLAQRHLALVVTMRDPGVEQLAALPPDTSERVYQRAVARTLLERREQTLRHLRARGILTVDVAADKLSSSVINRYLEIKARTAL